MLHAKFHGHWSTGSAEEVLKVFTIYGGHIGLVTWTVETYILFLKATYEIWL